MFQRIIVAIDLTDASQRIVDEGIQLAKRYGAKLFLLHVLSTEDELYPPYSLYPLMGYYSEITQTALENYNERLKAYENDCLKKLAAYQEQAISEGIEIETSQMTGGPGHGICETAEKWNADLILLGNRGRTGLGEMFLGSISNYVMHHAPCSVLILRPLQPEVKKVEEALPVG